jgi:AICAR transformylase/IMP cyclohydrolase PurH
MKRTFYNLLDVDAAVNLIHEFKNDGPTFAILKQQRLWTSNKNNDT